MVNTYSCAATCTASYTATTSTTTIVGCCSNADNCFANTVAAPLTCNTATGTVGCPGGICKVNYIKNKPFLILCDVRLSCVLVNLRKIM